MRIIILICCQETDKASRNAIFAQTKYSESVIYKGLGIFIFS